MILFKMVVFKSEYKIVFVGKSRKVIENRILLVISCIKFV